MELVDPVADVDPAASGAIFDDGVVGVFFWGDFVNGSAITLDDLAGVLGPESPVHHRCVCPDADVPYGEEIVLGVVVGVGVDFSCGYEGEGGVDGDGELDVAVLVSVELEFGFLLGDIVEVLVFLLLILHLLLDSLIDLAQPLDSSEDLGLRESECVEDGDACLIDVVEDVLVDGLAFDVGGVVLGEPLVLLLNLFEEDLEVLWLHEHDASPDELEQVDVLAELHGHVVGDLE